MFEKVGKQEDFLQRMKETCTVRRMPRVPHPYTCRISRKTVHRTILNEIKEMLMTDLRSR